MKNRFLIAALLLAAFALAFQSINRAAAQIASQTRVNESSESKFGIVEVNADKVLCLRTTNANLAANTLVAIIVADQKPQKILTARIEKKLSQSCAVGDSGDYAAANTVYYSLKNLRGAANSGLNLAIAVLAAAEKVKLQKGAAIVDASGDGVDERFRVCASNEGLHFTVWNGAPLKGARLWHEYYYLNYDTEPNCTEKESAEDQD